MLLLKTYTMGKLQSFNLARMSFVHRVMGNSLTPLANSSMLILLQICLYLGKVESKVQILPALHVMVVESKFL